MLQEDGKCWEKNWKGGAQTEFRDVKEEQGSGWGHTKALRTCFCEKHEDEPKEEPEYGQMLEDLAWQLPDTQLGPGLCKNLQCLEAA